jgi:hypothetical protein
VITGVLRHGADSAAPPRRLQPNERRNALSAGHADKRGLDALESATISEIRGKSVVELNLRIKADSVISVSS